MSGTLVAARGGHTASKPPAPRQNPAPKAQVPVVLSLGRSYRLQQRLKKLLDVLLSILILFLIFPVLLLVAAAVKATSPGPVLYKSQRIGRDGTRFEMYKFRTMRVGVNALRDTLREQTGQENDLFKLENDPRVTALGGFLRKYSLDEFPQLINVLRGEMSLVGPRPLMPDESALFREPYTMRFHVLPGITGLWQVSGRSNLNFKQLCDLELSYVLNWNLLRDFHILLRTIPSVLLRRGAY